MIVLSANNLLTRWAESVFKANSIVKTVTEDRQKVCIMFMWIVCAPPNYILIV